MSNITPGQSATELRAILDNLNGKTISVQDLCDILTRVANSHIALLRYIEREWPDDKRIRDAVFGENP